MTNEKFLELVDEIRNASIDTLKKKNANYSTDKDPLRNFHIGGAMIGGTGAQAALGYMAKHLACLVDKVNENDFHDREDLLEKCQDIINYTVFIWCLGNEEMEKYCKQCAEEKYVPKQQGNYTTVSVGVPRTLEPIHFDLSKKLGGTLTNPCEGAPNEAYLRMKEDYERRSQEGHRAMEYPD